MGWGAVWDDAADVRVQDDRTQRRRRPAARGPPFLRARTAMSGTDLGRADASCSSTATQTLTPSTLCVLSPPRPYLPLPLLFLSPPFSALLPPFPPPAARFDPSHLTLHTLRLAPHIGTTCLCVSVDPHAPTPLTRVFLPPFLPFHSLLPLPRSLSVSPTLSLRWATPHCTWPPPLSTPRTPSSPPASTSLFPLHPIP